MDKKKRFNIVFNPNANEAEITDSLADLFEAADILEDTQDDGFQFVEDAIASLQAQPQLTEVVNDFPEFFEAVKQVPPAVLRNAVFAARARAVQTRGSVGKITTFIGRGLLVLSGSYEYAIASFQGGQQQVQNWTGLFAGTPMFPDELPAAELPSA